MKKLVIGVTGSIAAVKIPALLTLLRGKLDVTIAMTDSAREFVGPQAFLALTGNPVITTIWEPAYSKPKHIDLADELDALLIAPATANIIGKMANGVADDPVSTLAISVLPNEKPVIVAPAMNTRMWKHPATQHNVETLRSWGIHIVDPAEGDLACGWQGVGRLAEPDAIAEAVLRIVGEGTKRKNAASQPRRK
ncbi:MAG: phosphopantothenoylcysteine decarboxylase [Planctomycetes bacterium]|nr:phosphopantothenoylcysteine decarboxylase [Planctomycetota bacterium]NUQ33780.1 phosphopantothenoylcysteine decarboxylase [Planctomycetaceae bacterium]